MADFQFACPVCGEGLTAVDSNTQQCPQNHRYQRHDGIWHFLSPERVAHFAQFIQEYETVRAAEGRGSRDPAYYRALPFADLSGQMNQMWHIRAQGFTTLLNKIMKPLESRLQPGQALKIADVGAGNGWLSYQLAKLGHRVAAIDLTINKFDGLGTHAMYDADFVPIQAEFDHLPLESNQVDLLIFNASLHYAIDYERTLREAWRVVRGGGKVVVLDTAVYHNPHSGQQMVAEQEAAFTQQYGFPSNAIASEHFLTHARLAELATALNMQWTFYWPIPRWRRTLRRTKAALRGQREPAQFAIIVGSKAVNKIHRLI